MKVGKPRVKFCWYCGNRLRSRKGGGFYYVEIVYQNNPRILHKQCKEIMERENSLIR
jgi:hypothetical protein